MMMITVPIFFPLVLAFGLDPIWFGVIMLLTLEIAGITPPFGMGLFVMLGVSPRGTTIGQVAIAALPYVLLDLVLFLLLLVFPAIALFLPGLMQ
jgi:TRAP-type C4-dicarboxylate transport system permease large subunit